MAGFGIVLYTGKEALRRMEQYGVGLLAFSLFPIGTLAFIVENETAQVYLGFLGGLGFLVGLVIIFGLPPSPD